MSEDTQMSVRVRRANLEMALKSAHTCVPGKAVPAVLACVLLEARRESLTIRSTDLNQSLRVTIPCSVDQAGTIAVRSKKFMNLVSSLAQGEVKLSVQSNLSMLVSLGATKAKMPGVPGATFPSSFVPCTSWIARFVPGDLAGLIGSALPALGEDDQSGLALSSALLRLTPAGVLLVATDHFRLSRAELRSSTPTPEDRDILLPRRLLKTLTSLFPVMGDAPVDLGLTDEAIFFRGGNYLLAARRVVGNFPAFEKAIPVWKREIRISAPEMLAAVSRLEGFDDQALGKVHFAVRGQTLHLSAQTAGAYSCDEQIAVQWTGEEDVSFNLRSKCLTTCLRPLRHVREIILGIPDSLEKNSPVTVTPDATDPYHSLYLLMSTANHRGPEGRK